MFILDAAGLLNLLSARIKGTVSSAPAAIILGSVIALFRSSSDAPALRARSLASPTCAPIPAAVPAANAPTGPATRPVAVAAPAPSMLPNPLPVL